jgi:hypothetical protein
VALIYHRGAGFADMTNLAKGFRGAAAMRSVAPGRGRLA